MSLGTWEPESPSTTIKPEQLNLSDFVAIGYSENRQAEIQGLDNERITALRPLMKQSKDFWFDAAAEKTRDDIIALIHFFTLAEELHSELFAGDQSPVIALNKLLRKRKEPLDKEMLLWIKANSSNRFLPNGSVL